MKIEEDDDEEGARTRGAKGRDKVVEIRTPRENMGKTWETILCGELGEKKL